MADSSRARKAWGLLRNSAGFAWSEMSCEQPWSHSRSNSVSTTTRPGWMNGSTTCRRYAMGVRAKAKPTRSAWPCNTCAGGPSSSGRSWMTWRWPTSNCAPSSTRLTAAMVSTRGARRWTDKEQAPMPSIRKLSMAQIAVLEQPCFQSVPGKDYEAYIILSRTVLTGSGYDVCVSYETSTPFLTIQAGDIINPRVWEGVGTPGNVLCVVKIEHIIWEGDGRIKHKLCIFTD